MKYLIKFFTLLLFIIFIVSNASANNKIKIGLVVPLSGKNKDLGESILKSVRLAVNDIDDNKIIIIPKDNKGSSNQTLKVSKESYKTKNKINLLNSPETFE